MRGFILIFCRNINTRLDTIHDRNKDVCIVKMLRWKRGFSGIGPKPIARVATLVQDGNIFADFTLLANQHQAMNLGQGFPSFGSPSFLSKSLAVMSSGDSYCETGPENLNHQYSKPGEELLLSQVLIQKYSKKFNQPLTGSNICTTVGAQEGIFTTLSTFCNPNDEIVIITPSFDAYFKTALFLGLKVTSVQLRPPPGDALKSHEQSLQANDYQLDYSELRATLTNQTKILILNTPSAPLGKVYSKDELERIAEVVKDFPNLIVLSDEVYEYMVYDKLRHTHMATIGDMFKQTITLFSAGKTFSCTGWRLGYAIGPTSLLVPFKTVHSVINFSTTTLFQKAASLVFQEADQLGYYSWLQTLLQRKRDYFCSILKELGIEYILPNGGYFVVANLRRFYHLAQITDAEVAAMTSETPLHDRPDVKFSRWLTTEVGVCPIPMSPFYVPNQRDAANNWIRFAYCKDDRTLQIAGERLVAKLKNA